MNTKRLCLVTLTLTLISLSACEDPTEKFRDKTNQNSQQSIRKTSVQDKQNEEHLIQQLTKEEKIAIKGLEWTQSINLEKEYNNAIQKEDFRVWVVANRSTTMPGINLASQAEIKNNCGYKYLDGVGDILLGDIHRDYRKKAIAYAERYNQKMLVHCISNKHQQD